MKNRRFSLRVPYQVHVRFAIYQEDDHEQKFHYADSVNISHRGILISTRFNVDIGAHIILKIFTNKSFYPTQVAGKVVRVFSDDHQKNWYIGIEAQRMDRQLAEIVQQRQSTYKEIHRARQELSA